MWKPGQLVTVCGNIYRVKKSNNWMGIVNCADCSIWSDVRQSLKREDICFKFCFLSITRRKLPDDCYLERIKPKSSIG